MKLILISDPALSIYGPITPVFLLSKEFVRRGFDVTVVSSKFSDGVRKRFEGVNVEVLDLNVRNVFFSEPSKAFLEYWFRESLYRMNSRVLSRLGVFDEGDVVLNFSNTIVVKSDVWYAQGPIHKALDNSFKQFSIIYKVIYAISKRLIKYLDLKLIKGFAESSKLIISNSNYLRGVYEGLGVKVHGIIYEPLDTTFFHPTTKSPSSDYVLTYFGKETDYAVVKGVADAGVRVKAFGSKAPSFIPKSVLKHPNVEVLGYVSDEALVDLYSNALFTLFPFTEEPFGYIPVESMACGTPVLTYGKQGPSETVINNVTGWLVKDGKEMIKLAVKIWRDGYPSSMRVRCRERALEFDVKSIASEWVKVVEGLKS